MLKDHRGSHRTVYCVVSGGERMESDCRRLRSPSLSLFCSVAKTTFSGGSQGCREHVLISSPPGRCLISLGGHCVFCAAGMLLSLLMTTQLHLVSSVYFYFPFMLLPLLSSCCKDYQGTRSAEDFPS